MPKIFWRSCFITLFICGCAMFRSWQSIPPPGGCDQCHRIPISADWQMVYKAPILSDERNRDYFVTPEYNMPRTDQPSSSLELRKVEDLRCFDCHKSPNIAHKGRTGHYHHK